MSSKVKIDTKTLAGIIERNLLEQGYNIKPEDIEKVLDSEFDYLRTNVFYNSMLRDDEDYKMFEEGFFKNKEWFSNLVDFVVWCHEECFSSSLTQTQIILQRKFGTFENAYENYLQNIKERKDELEKK